MAEKIALKSLKCPTCGAPLKAKDSNESITCVYCGNTVVPVAEATPAPQSESFAGFGGVVKVEGIKTSSSALAYIEQLFEDYDWDAFAYSRSISVGEIDKLADSLKVSSADDKNTWQACFKAIAVPYVHKVESCERILEDVVDAYKKENLDAYSKFDAYKRIVARLCGAKDTVVSKLERIVGKAEKYGATEAELQTLRADVAEIKALSPGHIFKDIEDIPAVRNFIDENNARIEAALAEHGINVKDEYAKAKQLAAGNRCVDALNTLLVLNGYADTKALIEKLDKYFLISDILEVGGVLYCFKKNEENSSLTLHPTVEGKIQEKPLIKNIKWMITNHANILYYLDTHNKIKKFDLDIKKEEKLYDKPVSKEKIFVYSRNVYMLTNEGDEYSSKTHNVVALTLKTGEVSEILSNVKDIVSFSGNKMVYKIANSTESGGQAVFTNVYNADTKAIVGLGKKRLDIKGFLGNYVVYATDAPNAYNKNLYIKELTPDGQEKLLEANIYRFCGIIADKLFYYIGNSHNQTLINIECDGTGRREWPQYIHRVLFEQGGWVYFIRKASYNSILCKAHLDGTKYSVVAADIEEFVEIKNGYLYYINDESALVKVRMDGSNLQELCDDVEQVLSVQEDKIVFVSVDGRTSTKTLNEQVVTKVVKSIYAVEFSGSGKIKLAYDIKNAKAYDDDSIYYIATQKDGYGEETAQDELYKLDVATNQVEKLLTLKVKEEEKPSNAPTALIIALIAFFFGILGVAAEAPGLATVGFVTMLIALVVALARWSNGE